MVVVLFMITVSMDRTLKRWNLGAADLEGVAARVGPGEEEFFLMAFLVRVLTRRTLALYQSHQMTR